VPTASLGTGRTAARVYAVVLLLSLATVIGVTYGVVTRVLGGLDPSRMAQNIRAHETLFRVGIAGNLLYAVELLVLAAAVYVALREVDPLLALLAAMGRLAHAVVWVVITLNLFAALRLLGQPEHAAVPPDQRAALARLLLSGFDPYYVALLFWSLGSTVAAVLWLRSGWVPRALAVFGILASAWAAFCTCCLFIAPGFRTIVDLTLFDAPLVLFEIALGATLTVRGLRPPGRAADRP
jgi:hypothetical protein